MSFYNFLMTLIRLLHIEFYWRCILYTRTHSKITIIIFSWNFGTEPATKTLFLCFYFLIITHHISVSYYDQPLFAQNVLELALTLCIVFVADFFLGSLSKVFRKFCIRRRVIRRSAEIIISPVVVVSFYVW